MQARLFTADMRRELKTLELRIAADVIVWGDRYFVRHKPGDGEIYREAIVAFVNLENHPAGPDKGGDR